MFPPSSSGPITATACPAAAVGLPTGPRWFCLGRRAAAESTHGVPGRCCVAPCVCDALISWHAHVNDCCRLPYRRTRHAVWRSPWRPLLSFPTQWCRDGLSPTPVPCGVSAHRMPCQCQPTRRHAPSCCCNVLQRVPRLEALLRVSTLHECLKENRLHVC
jgi:hypothetical protein